MTRDDIIRMALEAGWKRIGRNHETGPEFPILIERLERFAALVAAAEREACAKLCKNKEAELLYKEGQTLPRGEPMLLKMASVANYCAAAIRARGDK